MKIGCKLPESGVKPTIRCSGDDPHMHAPRDEPSRRGEARSSGDKVVR